MLSVTRRGDGPIIHAGMNARVGDNINGPSLIRVPDWVTAPLGRYYLYFAHHEGRFIRLAYADAMEGPWTIHEPGVLDVAQSLFVTEDLTAAKGGEWVRKTGGGFLYAHVASPDLHIDHETKTIRMYYHGLLPDGEQRTRLAASDDGLIFAPLEPLLGLPYFRVFAHGEFVYAVAWGGALMRAERWEGPFETGPTLLQQPPISGAGTTFRHCAVLCRGDRLDLFYSRIGDTPERILHTVVDLSEDWNRWTASAPAVLLQPEQAWEGAELPVTQSAIGAAHGPEHGLRDPCIFMDEHRIFLLYCGAGESNIGLAEIKGL